MAKATGIWLIGRMYIEMIRYYIVMYGIFKGAINYLQYEENCYGLSSFYYN